MRPHPVRQLFEPQHRLDASNKRALIDRLRQIFVGASLEPGDDVLGVGFRGHRMIGVNGILASFFSCRQTAIPSIFGIMTSSRIRSG